MVIRGSPDAGRSRGGDAARGSPIYANSVSADSGRSWVCQVLNLVDGARNATAHRARQKVGARHARLRLRVAPLSPLRGAFDPPCAPWPSGGVGTKGVHDIQP